MIYTAWQFDNVPLDENVRNALDSYIEKNGLPEQILLETGLKELPIPEGMNIVVKTVSIPKNVLLIGKLS